MQLTCGHPKIVLLGTGQARLIDTGESEVYMQAAQLGHTAKCPSKSALHLSLTKTCFTVG